MTQIVAMIAATGATLLLLGIFMVTGSWSIMIGIAMLALSLIAYLLLGNRARRMKPGREPLPYE